MGRPATRTCSTDFLLREGSSREEIGKWLKNKSVPWRRRRRLLQVVTGTFPCGQQMPKYGYRKTVACMLCSQKAYEECGGSWNGALPKETIGHIQRAGCLGQKKVVTTAHNSCIRELLQEVNVHGKADRHMRLLTKSVINFARRKSCGKQQEMNKRKPRGGQRMRGRQYWKSSIQKDSGGEDWMELAPWKGQRQLLRSSTRVWWRVSKRSVKSKGGRYSR
jgi:hypothetical protein